MPAHDQTEADVEHLRAVLGAEETPGSEADAVARDAEQAARAARYAEGLHRCDAELHALANLPDPEAIRRGLTRRIAAPLPDPDPLVIGTTAGGGEAVWAPLAEDDRPAGSPPGTVYVAVARPETLHPAVWEYLRTHLPRLTTPTERRAAERDRLRALAAEEDRRDRARFPEPTHREATALLTASTRPANEEHL